MLNQTRKSLSTEVSRAAGEAFDAGSHALESTKSALIATTVGAAVAALVLAMRRKGQDH